MTQRDTELRRNVAANVEEIVNSNGYKRWAGIEEAARCADEDWPPEERRTLLREGAARLFGESERRRRQGLRKAYSVHRASGTLSLALLDQTFVEAQATVAREESHAAGAGEQAAWDRYVLSIAEERCVERGQDPQNTEMVLRDFLDEAEVSELRTEWIKDQAA